MDPFDPSLQRLVLYVRDVLMGKFATRTSSRWGAIGLVLAIGGILPIALSLRGEAATDPQRGMSELRALFGRGGEPSENELLALERRYPGTSAAALARFLRGYRRYTSRDYAAAVALLTDSLIPAKTKLGDYALLFAARSLQALGRAVEAEAQLVKLWRSYPDSLQARSALLEAARSALNRGDARATISYVAPLAESGEAAALLLQAEGYERLGQPSEAIRLYERIYFDLPPARESAQARERLLRLGVVMDGVKRYGSERVRRRADRLYAAGAYEEAAEAYRAWFAAFPEAARDEAARLRLGVSLFRANALREAIAVLRSVSARASAELQSEALYWLAEAYRRLGRAAEFLETSQQLVARFPRSPWAARTLFSRAQFHLKNEEREAARAAFQEIVTQHPDSEFVPEALWRLGWEAYGRGDYSTAARLLLQLAAQYPQSDFFARGAYWAARAEQKQGRSERAQLLYERIAERYRDAYYGQMARQHAERMRAHRAASASVRRRNKSGEILLEADPLLERVLENLHPVSPPPETAAPRTLERVEKALELRLIRLEELALSELTAAQSEAPRSPRVCLELARLYRDRGDPLAAINALRQAHPEYAAYRGDEVPEEVLRLLFPLTHWDLIRRHAQAQRLDPYLVAALIRQESGFHPRARSVANARGLMQLIPATGRLVARRYGLRRLSPERLYDPALNIRLGTAYLADQLRRFGRIEYALAAYNAGPVRVTRWLRELPTEEMDEWIESIPISETREYVKNILRNVAHYRRLYGSSSRGI